MSRLRELNDALVDGPAAKWGIEKRYERSVLLNDAALELAELIDAAQAVVVLEYDPSRSESENTEFRRRADAFREALRAVEAKL